MVKKVEILGEFVPNPDFVYDSAPVPLAVDSTEGEGEGGREGERKEGLPYQNAGANGDAAVGAGCGTLTPPHSPHATEAISPMDMSCD